MPSKEEIKAVIEKLKEPEFENFQDLCEWREKNRGTDSQLYSEGFEDALEALLKIINS